jgi:hypothetical protein
MNWEDYKNREDRLGGDSAWDIYLTIVLVGVAVGILIIEIIL